MNNTKEKLESAHKFCSHHKDSIIKSKKCGCFYCLEMFNPAEIIEWVDDDSNGVGQTAICPKCEIDSVLGDNDLENLDKQFLKEMHLHWFGKQKYFYAFGSK